MAATIPHPPHYHAIKAMIDDIKKNIINDEGRVAVHSAIYHPYVRAVAGMDKYDAIGSSLTINWCRLENRGVMGTYDDKARRRMIQRWFITIMNALFSPRALYKFRQEVKKYDDKPGMRQWTEKTLGISR